MHGQRKYASEPGAVVLSSDADGGDDVVDEEVLLESLAMVPDTHDLPCGDAKAIRGLRLRAQRNARPPKRTQETLSLSLTLRTLREHGAGAQLVAINVPRGEELA